MSGDLERAADHLPPFQAAMAKALIFVAEVAQGPRTDPLPVVSPDNWHSMRCRHDKRVPSSDVDMLTDHGCCRCEHCRWQARNGPIVDNWRVSQDKRPHRLYSYPFGSVGAALASLHQPDGSPSRSRMGSLLSRLKEVKDLGAAIQTTNRHDRDAAEIRRSVLSVDVARCVALACSREDVRGDVNTSAAVLLIALSSHEHYRPEPLGASLGVSTGAVRGIVSRARKRATVEMAARDLIPEPRMRAGLTAEIAKRRIELGV